MPGVLLWVCWYSDKAESVCRFSPVRKKCQQLLALQKPRGSQSCWKFCMKHKQVLVLKAKFGKHIWNMLWAVYYFLCATACFTFLLKTEWLGSWWCTAPLIFLFLGPLLLPNNCHRKIGNKAATNPTIQR